MGVFDNISDPTSTAVQGGNVAKPLVIGLLSVLASRYMSGASKDTPASANPNTGAISKPTPLPVRSPAALEAYSNSFNRMVSETRSTPG